MTRILWLSNAPWARTGYGDQTLQFCAQMSKRGYEIAVLANYGLAGARMDIRIDDAPVRVYPQGKAEYSNDAIAAVADDWKADLIVSLYDAWPLRFGKSKGRKIPWVAWAPIDHETVSPPVLESLRSAEFVVAYAQHGQQALEAAGIRAAYVPHGVNSVAYCPGDQAEARERAELPGGDTFVCGMVAANNYYPSRKCIPQAMKAFADFHVIHTNSALYLHMVADESNRGVNVHQIAESLGLKVGKDLFIADSFENYLGYPTAAMADLYRSFDVLLNPSYGEGFGLPILEAQACGTPVIATRASAMTELVKDTGWLVDGEPWWSQQGAWQVLPHVDEISQALDRAFCEKYNDPGKWQLRQENCRAFAVGYDWTETVAPAWDALLQRIAGNQAGLHVHHWSNTGVYVDGEMLVPCTEPRCSAYYNDTQRKIYESGLFQNTDLVFEDDPQGGVAKIVLREIEKDYRLNEIQFEPGDVVLDVGAHVGVVSIWLLKQHPDLKVYAFEPQIDNFERLQNNRDHNLGSQHLWAFCKAITGDGREVLLSGDGGSNSGGWSIATSHGYDRNPHRVASLTLKQVFDSFGIERVKLLKIDCEGAEYEIFQTLPIEILERIDYIVGEFHDPGTGVGVALAEQLERLKPGKVSIKVIPVENLNIAALPAEVSL